jgi:hypothetical protein
MAEIEPGIDENEQRGPALDDERNNTDKRQTKRNCPRNKQKRIERVIRRDSLVKEMFLLLMKQKSYHFLRLPDTLAQELRYNNP